MTAASPGRSPEPSVMAATRAAISACIVWASFFPSSNTAVICTPGSFASELAHRESPATDLSFPLFIRFPIPVYATANSLSLESIANLGQKHDHQQSNRVGYSNDRAANRRHGVDERRLIRLVHRSRPSPLALLLLLSLFLNCLL